MTVSPQQKAAKTIPAYWRAHLGLLLSLGAACAAVFFFIELASEIAEGDTRHLDEAILISLRQPLDPAEPIGPLWLQVAAIDITALGSTTILAIVTLTAAGFLLSEGKRRSAFLVALSVLGGTLISNTLKAILARPRPDMVAHLVEVESASFPSGHAMLSAIVYLTLGLLLARTMANRRTQILILGCAVFLTITVGLSRIYLGVHYPTDVLGGWCAGAAWAIFCLVAAEALEKRRSGAIRRRGPDKD